MRLGNGKWETAKFKKRLQVTELGLGHASQDESLWKVNYEFGEFDSNNGLVDTTKNTGNIAKQTVSFNGLPNAFVQTYQYDSLYRLKGGCKKQIHTLLYSYPIKAMLAARAFNIKNWVRKASAEAIFVRTSLKAKWQEITIQSKLIPSF